MKRFLCVIVLALAVNTISYSYGMADDKDSFVRTGFGLSEPSISVPRLEAQQERQQVGEQSLVGFPSGINTIEQTELEVFQEDNIDVDFIRRISALYPKLKKLSFVHAGKFTREAAQTIIDLFPNLEYIQLYDIKSVEVFSIFCEWARAQPNRTFDYSSYIPELAGKREEWFYDSEEEWKDFDNFLD